MTDPKPRQDIQKPMPAGILDSIASFMRSLNTARLYASGHDLFKKNIQDLFDRLQKPLTERDFLFLGCARESFFLEGEFYQAKDVHLQKFLEFFHSLGISHILIDRKVSIEEMEAFLELLAGARQGQGNEVFAALPRENIKRISIGLLDYTIFSTVQTVAAQLAGGGEDEAVWRQLIVQPAVTAAFNLDHEKLKQITLLADSPEELKKMLLQLDDHMTEKKETVTPLQRGILLGNLIQNLGNTLSRVDTNRRETFPKNVRSVLDTLDPRVRTQVIGSIPPDPLMQEESGVIQEIFQDMEDRQVIHLLYDALHQSGPNSPCFNNLFNRSLARYREAAALLHLIREEMNQATQQRKPGAFNHWQHLEQRLIREDEAEELNKQYRNEIEALATSIQMEAPMVEDEEMHRLMGTLNPRSLSSPKAYLIVDLLSLRRGEQDEAVVPSLLENLGESVIQLFKQERYETVGNLIRDVFIALSDYPQESLVRKTINTFFNTDDIRQLLGGLLRRCRTYELKETTAADAVTQLYPEKAGEFLIDRFLALKGEDAPEARWLYATIASIGPKLSRALGRRLQDAGDQDLPQLLELVSLSDDSQVAPLVEQILDHQNNDIRIKAVETLGRLNAQRAVPRLGEILSQKSWLKGKKLKSLQEAAARALALINSDMARRVLEEAADGGSGEIKALCRELLQG